LKIYIYELIHVSKQVRAILVVQVLSLFPVIAQIYISLFPAVLIIHFLKVEWPVYFMFSFSLPSYSSLFLLKPVFLFCSSIIVTFLHEALIRSAPAVSRWKTLSHVFIDVVKIDSVWPKSIHSIS
jgi:hypothetical protein